MNKSESIKNLAQALLQFHAKMGKISKDSDNPFFKSKYAGLPTILEGIKEPLKESGLVFIQLPSGSNLTTILMHGESGEWIESTAELRPVKQDPQALGSAITYMRRYALGAILGLNIDEDDDGNAASGLDNPTPTPPANDKPWLTDDKVNEVVEYLKSKGLGIESVEAKYRINKKNRELILKGIQ
jgi:hypothetical protein